MKNRRILAALLSALMLLILVPMGALAKTGGLRPGMTLDDALNADDTMLYLHFTSSGSYPFQVGQDSEYQFYAGSSNSGVNSSESVMTCTASFQANDELSFYYLVDSEPTYDWFDFYIDGTRVVHESGESGILLYSYSFSSGGSHTLQWKYTKDSSQSEGLDMVKIYQVKVRRAMPGLDEALNSEDTQRQLHFTTTGAYPFEVGQEGSGQYYAHSTNVGVNSSQSYMACTASFQAGDEFSFYYYLESESNYDWFNFYIDGEMVVHESGESGILLFTHYFTNGGSHTLEWIYIKDSSQSAGVDMVKIYEVKVRNLGGGTLMGDVNNDGSVNVTDALLVLRLSMGLITSLPNYDAADVNGDGSVNMTDALLILRVAMGIITL